MDVLCSYHNYLFNFHIFSFQVNDFITTERNESLLKGFGRAILKLKFSYDKPNLYIPTCILNLAPGQKFET